MLKTSIEARETSSGNSLHKGLVCEVVAVKDTLLVFLKNTRLLQSYRTLPSAKDSTAT